MADSIVGHFIKDIMSQHDFKPLLTWVEFLLSQDETEFALKCLDMLPGYYRDNVPKEIESLKKEIRALMHKPIDLIADWREEPKNIDYCVMFTVNSPRGILLRNEILDANKQGYAPHIVDFGPGDFCFPIGLDTIGLNFTYSPISFSKIGKEVCEKHLGDKYGQTPRENQQVWFVAYEIIEHLTDITEIRGMYDRESIEPNRIYLSTPKYCFNTVEDWRKNRLHHLRTYTPKEFMRASTALFPEYTNWNYVDDAVMICYAKKD